MTVKRAAVYIALSMMLLFFSGFFCHISRAEKQVVGIFDSQLKQVETIMFSGDRKQALKKLVSILKDPSKKKHAFEIKSKLKIFSEQFYNSDSFQQFQEAKSFLSFARYDECIRELDQVFVLDQDNWLVQHLKAECLYASKNYRQSKKIVQDMLEIFVSENSLFLLAKINFEEKNYLPGLQEVEEIESIAGKIKSKEALVILKARLLDATGKVEDAIHILKKDHESNLDHIESIFWLAKIQMRSKSTYWQARKNFSLFISRCKRLSESEMKIRNLEEYYKQSQEAVLELDRKLEVSAEPVS